MTTKKPAPIFCLPLNKVHAEVLPRFFGSQPIIHTLGAAPKEELLQPLIDAKLEALSAAKEKLAPLCGGNWLPESAEAIRAFLCSKTVTVLDWRLRNFGLMTMLKHLVYVVDEESLTSLDIVPYLTASRLLGGVSVGLLSPAMRQPMDPTVLTMTDVLVVTEEPRSVQRVLTSLTQG